MPVRNTNACGPFTQTRLMGASIIGVSSSVGWESESTSVTVNLVEDLCTTTERVDYVYDCTAGGYAEQLNTGADAFQPVKLGHPVHFKFGSFEFGGILKNWERTSNVNGGITFVARLTDPTDLLDATQVILKANDEFSMSNLPDYPDPVTGTPIPVTHTPNIFNVSSFCEPCLDVGCLIREPTWSYVKYNMQGQYIHLNSGVDEVEYFLDLSEIPYAELMLTGDSTSMLEIINTVCTSLGYRWRTEVVCVGTVLAIKIFTHSIQDTSDVANTLNDAGATANDRLAMAGEISSVFSSNIVQKSEGVEYQNAITDALIGGDFAQTIWTAQGSNNNINQYWGFYGEQVGGNPGPPIYGSIDGNGMYNFTVDVANEPFDVGTSTYNIPILELRAAMHSFESWLAYMQVFKPDIISSVTGITGFDPIFNPTGLDAVVAFLNGGQGGEAQAAFAGNIFSETGQTFANRKKRLETPEQRLQNLHQFVSSYNEYYGQKWAVSLSSGGWGSIGSAAIACCPSEGFDNQKQTWEQSDGGWYEGTVLGLIQNSASLEIFKTDDGRIGPILAWTDSNLKLDSLGSSQYYTDGNKVWIKPSFEGIHLPCDGSPVALFSGGPIEYDSAAVGVQGTGLPLGNALWAFLLDEHTGQSGYTASKESALNDLMRYGSFAFGKRFGLVPGRAYAEEACVPSKSNLHSYGPWYATTHESGKAHYERDTNFNPWNFGKISIMESAAQLLADSMLVGQSVMESGSAIVPGGPTVSLGSAISGLGPNITGIDISIDTNGGVTTTYRMRTQVTDFGALTRQRIQYLQTLGTNARKQQRAFNLSIANRNPIPVRGSYIDRQVNGGGTPAGDPDPRGDWIIYEPVEASVDGNYIGTASTTNIEGATNSFSSRDSY